jgi:soluble lytic murein transglycosylase
MKRKRAKWRRRFFLLAVVTIVGFLFLKSDMVGKWLYPIHYQNDIRASASNYGLEPHLVAAVIRAESNFQTGRESHKGALGLMQLMPTTADWVVEKAGFESVDEEMLKHRADVSIEMGSWYLSSLKEQFDQNVFAAVAAYNAGPGNVRKWLDEGRWDGKLETADDIPFGETRRYVQKVNYYYNKYKELYPGF